jgi:hypothetical protein
MPVPSWMQGWRGRGDDAQALLLACAKAAVWMGLAA